MKPSLNLLVKFTTLSLFLIFLEACGGGGGTTTPAATTTTTPTTSTALTGKLIPEIRQNGFSQLATTNSVYKASLDENIGFMNTITAVLGVRFAANIPVFFSGCGETNALFVPASFGTVHAALNNRLPSRDTTLVFGSDRAVPAILICHELTERSFLHFRLKVFPDNTTLALESSKISAAIFDLSMLFHEVGHAILVQHFNQIVDVSAMQAELKFPVKDSCQQLTPNCNTFNEDFADLISAYGFVLMLNGLAVSNPVLTEALIGGFLVGVGSWVDILGLGGDAAHGFTSGRQANIMCNVYGGAAALRAADTNGVIANAIATLTGMQSANDCQGIYAANEAAIVKHLGFAFPP